MISSFAILRLFIYILLISLTPLSAKAQEPPQVVIGTLKGSTFDLSQHYGKIVIVNFWATWCPPCREEMPILDEIYRTYHIPKGRRTGLEMIAISSDQERDYPRVQELAQTVSYPIGHIGQASVNTFGKPRILPITYIIDRQGHIAAELNPSEREIDREVLEETILPLLTAK